MQNVFGVQSRTSVSYTHLDVYKRQDNMFVPAKQNICRKVKGAFTYKSIFHKRTLLFYYYSNMIAAVEF